MSRFTEHLYRSSAVSVCGMVTGEPGLPRRQTWGELHQTARRMAGALSRHVEAGARVAILAGDPAEVAPLVQAVWMRRGAFTMLQHPTPRTDLGTWSAQTRRVLDMIDAEVLVVGAAFDAVEYRDFPCTVLTLSDLIDGPDTEPLECGEDDAAVLQLSSGSTGDPKAVVITHRNLYTNITAMLTRAGLASGADEVAVSWLPLSHDMGMIALLAMPMMAGIELVSITPADFLRNPLLWAELISRYRATFTGAPNFAYTLLGHRLERADDNAYGLSSMRYAINGAEPIDCAAMDGFVNSAARFGWPATALATCYGMAEAVVAVSAPERGAARIVDRVERDALETERRAQLDENGSRYAVLGQPLSGVDARVVDPDTGITLGARSVGEFELRGECVTAGYLTTAGFAAGQDRDGWLRTGDLGYLTEHGELVICGRQKDVIIVSGRNLYPTDIERAAERVEGIRGGNVIAVSVDAATATEGFAVLAESLHHRDLTRVTQLRRDISVEIFTSIGVAPRIVTILAPGALPKTTSGKLRRAHARQLLTTRA
ncbi:fatty acyl-AMP ligase [Nocardia sp. NPDC052566]|uniref:fatty acyl-AMP ligase n=1 Tax=Nocardia sp. NPDC052566 TaxID=3364330 RepID=UPI0037C70FF5